MELIEYELFKLDQIDVQKFALEFGLKIDTGTICSPGFVSLKLHPELHNTMTITTKYNIGDNIWVIEEDEDNKWSPGARGTIYDIAVSIDDKNTNCLYYLHDRDGNQITATEGNMFKSADDAYTECDSRNERSGVMKKPEIAQQADQNDPLLTPKTPDGKVDWKAIINEALHGDKKDD